VVATWHGRAYILWQNCRKRQKRLRSACWSVGRPCLRWSWRRLRVWRPSACRWPPPRRSCPANIRTDYLRYHWRPSRTRVSGVLTPSRYTLFDRFSCMSKFTAIATIARNSVKQTRRRRRRWTLLYSNATQVWCGTTVGRVKYVYLLLFFIIVRILH